MASAGVRSSKTGNSSASNALLHRKTRSTYDERKSEAFDQVRGNIDQGHRALFERVKGQLKAGPRKSLTEAFAQYAHDHPREAMSALQSHADRKVEALIAQRMGAGPGLRKSRTAKAPRAKALPKTNPRRKFTAAELASTPF